ncbi:uncharacterized protein EV154DRAFT_498006 [Mucor mucedo]|uniref:uncharacterized protein n=1 Tax=Mucor mucedo TaxID=29922 RepID=UPI00221F0807|nr:uncharacterized protein EV154DRAFT_498006 [Mucor mucedo]KAI7894501.1 hypothetical protein EV154DRAFT_498006 [Mucor mucedo]
MEFTEVDNIMVSGLNTSIGSYIGSLARRSLTHDRQSYYFKACGMNGILDMSDKSAGSQIHGIQDHVQEIRQALHTYDIKLSEYPELTKYDEITKAQTIRKQIKYFKKCLSKTQNLKAKDKLMIIKDSYEHVLKVHLFHSYLFNTQKANTISEQDYVIKIWSPLIEIMFRSLNEFPPIICHWGDTSSEVVKEDGKIIRMDLRLIASETDEKTDAAVVKFVPIVFTS